MPQEAEFFARHAGRERGTVARTLQHRLLAIDKTQGSVRVEFHADVKFCNPLGMVQGGIITAMLDLALSDAMMVADDGDKSVTMLEVNCNYLAPASHGRLLAEAEVLRQGRSTAFAEARLKDENGNVLVTASGVANLN